jgi:hypothetical protein
MVHGRHGEISSVFSMFLVRGCTELLLLVVALPGREIRGLLFRVFIFLQWL